MTLTTAEVGKAFDLTPMQEGMLFHALYAKQSGMYVEQIRSRFCGSLDVRAFEQAWQLIVARHDILRACFEWEGGERPHQIFQSEATVEIEKYDWCHLLANEQRTRLLELITHDREHGFDLSKAPLFRLILIKVAADEHHFIWSGHHILLDGWSQELVLNEVFAAYRALAAGEEVTLQSSRPFSDYVEWLRSRDGSMDEAFWREQLRDFDEPTRLEVGRVSTSDDKPTYDECAIVLSKDLTAALQSFARKHRLTPYTLVAGGWALLLSRYSGTEDIVFGSTVSTRPLELEGIEYTAGLFINTLPARVRTGDDVSLIDWLKKLQLSAAEVREFEHTALVDIQRWSELPPGQALFESLIVFENYPADRSPWDLGQKVRAVPEPSQLSRTNYPVVLLAMPGSELRLHIVFHANRFERQAIERMLSHFQILLEGFTSADVDSRLSDISLLTSSERNQILNEWNNTKTNDETEVTVAQLIERQTAKTPQAVAVQFEDNSISYDELNARANKLARHLRARGARPETLIAIYLERSIDMVIGLLGILKSGAAYVPLDPAFPKERLAFMLQDSDANLLLTQQSLRTELAEIGAQIVCIDSDWDTIDAQSGENVSPAARSTNLAYIIYTSGSTGKPKGVQIEHRALVNFLHSMRQEPGLSSSDVLLSVTTISFDIAGLEIYLPLVTGGRLVIASREVASDGLLLKDKLAESGATVMQATPATWQMLIDAGWSGDAQLRSLGGGEALSRELANELLSRCGELWNMYGPTETTIWSTIEKITSSTGAVSIGRPIANTQIYLLDRNRQPVPIGIAGELCIGGDGLARGYLNRPELTAEKFIPNPFIAGALIYRTGDLARYLPDGSIECLGRIDHQVKVRGHRVEPGEIESRLLEHEAVHRSVVVAADDSTGGKRLVAYVVGNSGQLSSTELGVFLKKSLPDYMVPSAFVVLEELPLTPNGKVNRRALPTPEASLTSSVDYEAPRNQTERTLADIWSELLGVPRVSRNDNFFDLGGHSLLATRLASRLLQRFQIQLPLRALFECSTLETLARRIDDERTSTSPSLSLEIQPVTRNGSAPLSFGQEDFWFLNELNPNTSLYNIYRAVRLQGTLDVAALQSSLAEVVDRHEALRTTFAPQPDSVVQLIGDGCELEWRLIDLREHSQDAREAATSAALTQQAHIPFDLERGPLLRAVLVRLTDDENIFLVALHHIVVDDWSMSIFFNELWTLYNSLLTGSKPALANLTVQYADFALWQRDWLQNGLLDQQLTYWRRQLADMPPPLELPTDRPRSALQTCSGNREEIVLPHELIEQLNLIGRSEGATLFMTLLAAFQLLLARYMGADDIAVGSPIAGRNRAETEGLIGFFINTLVLRTDLSGNPTFKELLGRVRDVCLGAFANQDVPFGKLVEDLQPARTANHPPLFEVLFVFQNAPAVAVHPHGIVLTPEDVREGLAPLDLTIEVRETNDGAHCWFEYKTELFDAVTIARLAERFRLLLESIAADAGQKISTLQFLTATERQQLVERNDITAEYSSGQCIHELFEGQVERTPSAVAVVHEKEKLTYRQLNERANQLAHHLRSLGVGPETLVGICVERSIEMIVGVLGILKAGGAYVPLDPAYPRERLHLMIDDAKISVLLTQKRLVDALPHINGTVLCLDFDWSRIAENAPENPTRLTQAKNLAYVIYTSGSTGQPKGVMIEHSSLVDYVESAIVEFGLGHGDRVLQFASLSFDTSAEEIFPCLTRGAKLILRTDDMLGSVGAFLQKCRDWAITILDLPTAYWHELVAAIDDDEFELPPSLRLVIIGGERARPERLKQWQKHVGGEIRLLNTYGPTEATIVSTMWEAPADAYLDSVEVPIGRPVRNARAYVLDSFMQPAPSGIVGELYIAGAGLARGYLNQVQLTAEKFVDDSFYKQAGARIYKTGDLARLLPDGNIEYAGRNDNQVKIRGFRIELGEIEAVLNQHPSVRESAVIAREDSPGDKRVIAYVINSALQKADAAELRRFLSAKLPAFMLPSALVLLEKLPLTVNGKIDHDALPGPDELDRTGEMFEPPSTPVERTLAEIWTEVLKIQRVGKDENFFELGGHSLLATQVISRVRRAFEVELPLRSLFEAPTLSGLAAIIEPKLLTTRGGSEPTIKPVDRRQDLPLSFAQQRLWFIEHLAPGESVYNVNRAMRLHGSLDVPALQKALDQIVHRHEALRTNFTSLDGEPLQIIGPTGSIELNVIDLSGLAQEPREIEAVRILKDEAERPFNLAQDRLLRVTLLRCSDDEHLLLFTLHHTICDGWSMQVLIEELSALYAAHSKGESASLPELPIQYADFAYWQRELLKGEVFEKQLVYWKRQLAGAPTVLTLPTDRPRPRVQTFRGARQSLMIPREITGALRSLSQREGATLFMTLLAAWQTLLHRYSGEKDVVVGSPIAGRNCTETENLIGLFVNALALRTDLSGDPTFLELLDRVKEVALGAYAHQELPFEKLVEELQPERNLSYNPIFQVVFALQNGLGLDLHLEGLTVRPAEIETVTAKFDLTLDVIEKDDGLLCSLEYNSDLFDAGRIARMLSHFQILLAAVVSKPAQTLSSFPLLTETERHQLLVEWNDTRTNYPRNKCVHELFEEQAERIPDATAVVFHEQELTYADLNHRANRIASYLRRQGIGPESLVGICVDRSLELVVGLLGILKAGAAYVPLDAEYPRERLSFMLEDTRAALVLTQQHLLARLPESSATMLCLDSEWQTIAAESETNHICGATADGLAYVMYTSGSTGKPKGVAVTHRNIVRLVRDTNYATFGADEVFLQFAPVSFDASTFEIWGALLNGAKLAIMSPGTPSLEELGSAIARYGVTTLWLTSGLFHLMVDNRVADLQRLRQLLAGGDVLSVVHVKKFLGQAGSCRLINGYGPTEGTTFTCCYPIPKAIPVGESIPIGRPIANSQVYILDEHLQPLPVGVPGYLYVGGDGLARGYFNRPELTRERFIANPLVDDPDARLYRTGDLARYLPDGNIEFLGRSDQQVKIRGFRIEPGEIESVLNQHAAVKECVVVAREDIPGDKRLVAYVVTVAGSEKNIGALREYLSQKLPDYMTPSAFVFFSELPLSPNGKVERKALPAPGDERPELKKDFVAPRDELETRLAQIWESVLAVHPVGVRDNFFELGGHSLLAVRLFAQIERLFNRNLPLAILFQAPTIEGLASVLRRNESAARWSSLVAIQPGGRKQPFFCVHAVGGNVLEYHDLARHLGPDQPFYALQSQGLDGKQTPLTRIEEMASCYIRELSGVQPHGPYLIGGRSFGGIVAYEMACQLRALGEEVSLLALLDTYPVGYFKLAEHSGALSQRALRFVRRIKKHLLNLGQLPGSGKLSYMWTKLQYVPAKIKGRAWSSVFKIYEKRARPLPRLLRNIEQINYAAARTYAPQIYPGKVTLFLASGDLTGSYDLREGWEALVGKGVEIHEIEGDHINIIKEPFVGRLAAELKTCLDKAQVAYSEHREPSLSNVDVAA